ncbi:BatD family protein [Compostibacter hankyongensis]|uniref:BatD family protein n=2 Tax=Compostibacter hankyongensis TaxID=1007089 RepID=A0ABP8G087_9BACT
MMGKARAQDAQFTASASTTTPAVNEPFQLRFTLENASDISGFQPPAFTGFSVLSQSQGSSMNITNGHVSQSVSIIYILQATAPGRYTLAGASARLDGKKVKSNPITITVSAGSASPSPSPFDPRPRPDERSRDVPGMVRKGENVRDKIRKNLYAKVEVDKKDVYVGEQLTATYKLYTRMPTSSKVTRVPAFSGFSAHDIDLPNPPQATIEQVDGVPFKVFTIRKTMLFPLQPGDLELDSVTVENVVHLYEVDRSRPRRDPLDDFFDDPFGKDPFDDSFFDDFFNQQGGSYHDYNYNIRSQPVSIHVKPLPEEGRPADFSGAVGNFTIQAGLNKSALSTDDAATLKITLKGSGNITLLNAPKIDLPADFDRYDPKISDQVNKNDNPLSGSRTFEYVFMPRTPGDYTIPAIRFSYFDPQEKAYKTATSQPFTLHVTQGKNRGRGTGADYALPDNVLQPIHSGKLAWSRRGAFWLTAPLYWILLALPLLVLLILLATRRRREKLQSDQVLLKNKRANKVARKRLSLAARFLAKDDSRAFYEEVSKALWGYLSHKLNIPFAELSRQKATDKLHEREIPPAITGQLFALFDNCEMALYAGMSGHEKMQETYNQAATLIGRLEEQLK